MDTLRLLKSCVLVRAGVDLAYQLSVDLIRYCADSFLAVLVHLDYHLVFFIFDRMYRFEGLLGSDGLDIYYVAKALMGV
jgi:hypothetical protein